jgi:hypothetical protein
VIFECQWPDGCIGGNISGDMSCDEGYEGALCGDCEDGYAYSLSYDACMLCSDKSTIFTPFYILTAIVTLVASVLLYKGYKRISRDDKVEDADDLIILIMLYFNIVDRYQVDTPAFHTFLKQQVYKNRIRLIAVTRIYVTFYQILSALPFIIAVDFPNLVLHVADAVDFVNIGFSGRTIATCSNQDATYDAISMLYIHCAYPIVGVLLLYLVGQFHVYFKYGASKRSAQQKLSIIELRATYVTLTFLWIYLLLPSVSTSIFSMFR